MFTQASWYALLFRLHMAHCSAHVCCLILKKLCLAGSEHTVGAPAPQDTVFKVHTLSAQQLVACCMLHVAQAINMELAAQGGNMPGQAPPAVMDDIEVTGRVNKKRFKATCPKAKQQVAVPAMLPAAEVGIPAGVIATCYH
jgi:hypothetical protein